tara:strand:+ start:461 stop:757 length:297 start_codon:yes stop_codon:yes gene_type:complete
MFSLSSNASSAQRSDGPSSSAPKRRMGDPIVLSLTMGFIALFVFFSLFDASATKTLIGDGFTWTAKYLGSFFQVLLLLTFLWLSVLQFHVRAQRALAI